MSKLQFTPFFKEKYFASKTGDIYRKKKNGEMRPVKFSLSKGYYHFTIWLSLVLVRYAEGLNYPMRKAKEKTPIIEKLKYADSISDSDLGEEFMKMEAARRQREKEYKDHLNHIKGKEPIGYF